MAKVTDLLRHKGGGVYCAPESATVGAVAEILNQHNIGALIIGSTTEWHGLISERDLVRHLAHGGTRHDPITCCMTVNVMTVEPTDSIAYCSSVMTNKRIRHLPVVNGGELVGVISIGDVVRSMSAQKDFELEQLGRYITDSYPAAG